MDCIMIIINLIHWYWYHNKSSTPVTIETSIFCASNKIWNDLNFPRIFWVLKHFPCTDHFMPTQLMEDSHLTYMQKTDGASASALRHLQETWKSMFLTIWQCAFKAQTSAITSTLSHIPNDGSCLPTRLLSAQKSAKIVFGSVFSKHASLEKHPPSLSKGGFPLLTEVFSCLDVFQIII